MERGTHKFSDVRQEKSRKGKGGRKKRERWLGKEESNGLGMFGPFAKNPPAAGEPPGGKEYHKKKKVSVQKGFNNTPCG